MLVYDFSTNYFEFSFYVDFFVVGILSSHGTLVF